MWLSNIKEFGARKCCFLNCTLVLSGAMIKYGSYVPDVMIAGIKKNVSEKAAFWNSTIESVVNKCFNERKN